MPDSAPEGYRDAGTVTVTLRLGNGPVTIHGPVLEHVQCGRTVAPDGIEQHRKLLHPEGAEEAP